MEKNMLSFKDHSLIEMKDPRHPELHAFDLDDTLIKHDDSKLRVHVLDRNGNRVQSLTNKEFNKHQLPAGHSYDFHEFKSADVFGKSAHPIHKMIDKLKAIHKKNKNVEILTARSDMDDKDKFGHVLKKYGIDIHKIHVRRAGNIKASSAAEAKKKVMHDLISKEGYKHVHLYDDSTDNLDSFLSLKKKHPDVEFHAHHVQHYPETNQTIVTTRKA